MNDKHKKRWIAQARKTMADQQAIIEGYSKQITELKHRNQELQQLLAQEHARNSERLDEMECEQFNL